VTGPRFTSYTTTTKLTAYEWKFKKEFLGVLRVLGDSVDQLSREIAAEFLLREGVVTALWASNGDRPIGASERWAVSIREVAGQIPIDTPLTESIVELLSGMSDPGHYVSYISESGIELESMVIP
jgi:hypothetical protein